MHFLTIIAFVCIFWRAEMVQRWYVLPQDSIWVPVLAAAAPLIVLALIGLWASRRTLRLLMADDAGAERAQYFLHRVIFTLRVTLIISFGFLVLATPWTDWFAIDRLGGTLRIFGDLAALTPFFTGAIVLWLCTYPVERAVRSQWPQLAEAGAHPTALRLSAYLDLNIRHYLLTVTVPMLPILWTSNVLRVFDDRLPEFFSTVWASDFLLGAVAALSFVVSPMMLRRIWRTSPLALGPVRQRLEQLCQRLGLRCREILVWKSDGAMINAAVMGVIPSIRYILLSDALLTTMNPKQIEAVFGHEAGHVRHRHIPHFLGLAFIGWLVVAVLMEVAAILSQRDDGSTALSGSAIQAIGVGATGIFWIVGFGWVSRCFERQADLFGARCATPEEADCTLPCSVHLDPGRRLEDGARICATGAAVFASALDRVAGLNGIPRDEPSWRHSSIGSRLHFLASMAGDPARAMHFERRVRRVQYAIRAACLLGAIACVWYWTSVPEPAILRLGERRVPQAMTNGATR